MQLSEESHFEESDLNEMQNGIVVKINENKFINFSLIINGQVVGVNLTKQDATNIANVMLECVNSIELMNGN